MIKNYFAIALRSFWKQKTYTLLNISGLAIALATATLALLFIRHEFSYDGWIPNQSNIYRVYREWSPGSGNTYSPYLLAETLRDEFPEIENAAFATEHREVLISQPDQSDGVYVDRMASVDSTFLQVMPLPLKYGDPATALQNNHSLILSTTIAEQFFGDRNPVGEVLRENDEIDYLITGVFAPFEGNTHFDIDLVSRDTSRFFSSWTGNNPVTYVALHPETEVSLLEEKITEAINPRLQKELESYGASWDKFPEWKLQPIRDAHLNTRAQVGGPFSEGSGDLGHVSIIGVVALLMLLVASINYMNLSTAQAARRAREVGVRKVNGATRPQLVFQFLSEAILQCLVSLPIAILLAELALPVFKQMVDRDLVLDAAALTSTLPWLLILVLSLGALSGSYPAFFLAAYRPTEVLKGKWLRRDRGKLLRQGMVVVQFVGAIVAAIVMTFIYRQVQFMQSQDLGFESEQVLVIRANTQQTYQKIQSQRAQLSQNTNIKAITATASLPGSGQPDYMFRIGGIEQDKSINIFFVDSEFDQVLDLKVQEGRFLLPSDTTTNAFVVNESLIREYGIEDPIGHSLSLSGAEETGTIVGVIEDFHYSNLAREIRPLALSGAIPSMRRNWVSQVAVRLSTRDIRGTVAQVEQFWQQIEPAHPIRYSFLDDDFSQLYVAQERLGHTLLWATLLTLFVALLGLFGLASYMAEQRTKEIGVRKVLGATVQQITTLLSADFLKVVLLAGVIATPISFWLTKEWLTDFAYRTSITGLPFLLAITGAVVVAIVTVGSRAINAARANPAESLKSE